MAIEKLAKAIQAAEPGRAERRAPDAAAKPAGGIDLPGGGNGVPPSPAPAPAEISRAVSNLNKFLQENRRDFVFQVDESSGRTIVMIVNPNTGEIVRQIPPEEVLSAARTLREAGILLSARA